MRFDTNLYEARQRWIQNITLNENILTNLNHWLLRKMGSTLTPAEMAKKNRIYKEMRAIQKAGANAARRAAVRSALTNPVTGIGAGLAAGSVLHAQELNKAAHQHAADIADGSRVLPSGIMRSTFMN